MASSYVPPHLRKGATVTGAMPPQEQRQESKYRDDRSSGRSTEPHEITRPRYHGDRPIQRSTESHDTSRSKYGDDRSAEPHEITRSRHDADKIKPTKEPKPIQESKEIKPIKEVAPKSNKEPEDKIIKTSKPPIDVPDAIKEAAMNPDSVTKDKWAKERALFQKVAIIRSDYGKKRAQIEFNEWREYYDEHLRELCGICAEMGMPIPYPRFVRLAYDCSMTQFDLTQNRRMHPLI